jgi:hypothetical protein
MICVLWGVIFFQKKEYQFYFLYAMCNIITIGQICVTHYMFLCWELCSLSQCKSVTRSEIYVTKGNYCNT